MGTAYNFEFATPTSLTWLDPTCDPFECEVTLEFTTPPSPVGAGPVDITIIKRFQDVTRSISVPFTYVRALSGRAQLELYAPRSIYKSEVDATNVLVQLTNFPVLSKPFDNSLISVTADFQTSLGTCPFITI